jgi:hypothetical protein
MILKYDAIFALYPNVTIVRNGMAYDKDENIVEYDDKLVNAWVDANAYSAQRKEKYPSIENQLDMIWHSINNNVSLDKTSEFYKAIAAIKNEYPKD